jgi:hypothetical protein
MGKSEISRPPFLYLSKYIIYGFKTLLTIKTLQLQHDKNSSEFFFAV